MQYFHCPRTMICDIAKTYDQLSLIEEQQSLNLVVELFEHDSKPSLILFSKFFTLECANIHNLVYLVVHSFVKYNTQQLNENFPILLNFIDQITDKYNFTEAFVTLFSNLDYWSLDTNFVSSSILKIRDFLSNNTERIDFKCIESNQLIKFLLIACFFNDSFAEPIIQLISFILSNYSTPDIYSDIIDIILISESFSPKNSIDEIIESFLRTKNRIQDKHSLFKLVFESKGSLQQIPANILLQFTYFADPLVSKMFSYQLIEQLYDDEQPLKMLSVLARGFRNYAFDAIMWEVVIRLVSGIKFSFDQRYIKLQVLKPLYISLILEMLIPFYFSDGITEFFDSVLDTITQIVLDVPEIYIQSKFLPYFLDFIISDVNTDQSIYPSFSLPHEEADLLRKIEHSFPKFIDQINLTSKQQNRLFNHDKTLKITFLISKIVLNSENSEQILKILCQYGHSTVVFYTIHNILFYFHNKHISSEFSKIISRALIYPSIKRPEIYEQGNLYSSVLPIFQNEVEKNQNYVHWFLLQMNQMSPEYIEAYLEIISKAFVVKDVTKYKFALYILVRLLRIDIPLEIPFINEFFLKVKSLAKRFAIPLCIEILQTESIQNFNKSSELLNELDDVYRRNVEFFNDFCNQYIYQITEENMIQTKASLFTFFARNVVVHRKLQNFLFYKIDDHIRKEEMIYSFIDITRRVINSQSLTYEIFKEKTKSFRISHFHNISVTPSVLLPSELEIHDPTQETHEKQNSSENLSDQYIFMGAKPKYFFGPHKYAISYTNDVITTIKDLYSLKSYSNCVFTSSFAHIQSTIFTDGKFYYILLNSRFEFNFLAFLNDNIEYNQIREFAIDGDFGPYTMICSHPCLIVDPENSIFLQYHRGVQIFSRNSGNFIVEFLEGSTLIEGSTYDVSVFIEKALKREVSVLELLNTINIAAERSYSDMTSYPIFPRVSMNATSVTQRDLSIPIQLACDYEKSKELLEMRYNYQNYHHAENLSNPHFIAASLFRYPPFIEAEFLLNGGWDALSRIFVDIESQINVTTKTVYEAIPEMYSFSEFLENKNNLKINGELIETKFPPMISSSFGFVRLNRINLECRIQNINSWIDLVFGVDSRGPNALAKFNVFHPNSYDDNQLEWRYNSGCVPKQIFTSKFKDLGNDPVDLNEISETEIKINQEKEEITIGDYIIKISNPQLHHYCSDGLAFAITFSNKVFAFVLQTMQPLSFFNRLGCLHSAISLRFMVCATAYKDCIIIWNLATGKILCIIPYKGAQSMVFMRHVMILRVYNNSQNIDEFTINGTKV